LFGCQQTEGGRGRRLADTAFATDEDEVTAEELSEAHGEGDSRPCAVSAAAKIVQW
jgi:hypothetical protein